MKIISSPQSGRLGDVVFVLSRYGLLARKFVPPRNPRTQRQQAHRANFGAVASHWRALTPEQRTAWCLAAASVYIVNRAGRQVSLNGYNYFMRVNAARAHLGLSRFDLPPTVPTLNPNPVGELAITNTAGNPSLKLRVPSPPAQHTLVYGAAPVSPGVRCVQHFTFLGLLPAPVEGGSDITALYVARYGEPVAGKVVFIRTCQQVDGWTDLPKETSALVPAR